MFSVGLFGNLPHVLFQRHCRTDGWGWTYNIKVGVQGSDLWIQDVFGGDKHTNHEYV